jgi:hypothetical protein
LIESYSKPCEKIPYTLQEPELLLRRTAACTLLEIAKHSPELAQGIVDAGTIPFIAPLVSHGDAKLRREVKYLTFHVVSK